MDTTTTDELHRRRLDAVHARGRAKDSLLGIALDIVEPYASDYLSPADYERVCELVRGPVEAATDAALEALLEALAPALGGADPDIVARVEAIRRRSL